MDWERGYIGPKTIFKRLRMKPNYPYVNLKLIDMSNLTSIFGVIDGKEARDAELLPRDFLK